MFNYSTFYPQTEASEKFSTLSRDHQGLVAAVVDGTLKHLVPDSARRRVGSIFATLDRDGSQELTVHDFADPFNPLHDTALRQTFQHLLNVMDQNNDGKISQQEFFAFFVISALFGGFEVFDGAPHSALALGSNKTIGEQLLEIHLCFASRFEAHVSKFEDILRERRV